MAQVCLTEHVSDLDDTLTLGLALHDEARCHGRGWLLQARIARSTVRNGYQSPWESWHHLRAFSLCN